MELILVLWHVIKSEKRKHLSSLFKVGRPPPQIKEFANDEQKKKDLYINCAFQNKLLSKEIKNKIHFFVPTE